MKEMMNIRYSKNTASENALNTYFISNKGLFAHPQLKERGLQSYINKIRGKAVIFEAWHNDQLIGLLAAYFNDFESKTAFISLIGISPKYQRMGIAAKLLFDAINYGKKIDIKKIRLEVNRSNRKAITFYKDMGFVIMNDSNEAGSLGMVLDIDR